jgi:hypothetical protein
MTKRQHLRGQAQQPEVAGVCRAHPGFGVTKVLSTASVRRPGRFSALPYPPGVPENLPAAGVR